ncbi:MAG: hypothetical protein ABWY56_00610, partial [Propionibacteriaceae bacterium]
DTASGNLSLYEMAGLDPALWTILSVDISAGSTNSLTLYAFDRRAHGISSYADLLEVAQHSGELPVTAFSLTQDSEFSELARMVFKQLLVRLTARGVSDQRLAVQHHQTLPRPRETPGR